MPKSSRNPFQEYINIIKAAWRSFDMRYPHEWLLEQTDVELVCRIWNSEAPKFSIQTLWDSRRVIDSSNDARLLDMYQRTVDDPHNKQLIDYFTRFNSIPIDIETQVMANRRGALFLS